MKQPYRKRPKGKLTKFSDGSSLEDLGNGGWAVREHDAKPCLVLREQPAPYSQRPPKPNRSIAPAHN